MDTCFLLALASFYCLTLVSCQNNIHIDRVQLQETEWRRMEAKLTPYMNLYIAHPAAVYNDQFDKRRDGKRQSKKNKDKRKIKKLWKTADVFIFDDIW